MANAVKQTTKTVYIVLSATPTIPARIIRLLSGHVYSHVSITSDRSLGELYSFCRRYKYFPFPGGPAGSGRAAAVQYKSTGKGDSSAKVHTIL